MNISPALHCSILLWSLFCAKPDRFWIILVGKPWPASSTNIHSLLHIILIHVLLSVSLCRLHLWACMSELRVTCYCTLEMLQQNIETMPTMAQFGTKNKPQNGQLGELELAGGKLGAQTSSPLLNWQTLSMCWNLWTDENILQKL